MESLVIELVDKNPNAAHKEHQSYEQLMSCIKETEDNTYHNVFHVHGLDNVDFLLYVASTKIKLTSSSFHIPLTTSMRMSAYSKTDNPKFNFDLVQREVFYFLNNKA